jgi:hypothetical protein
MKAARAVFLLLFAVLMGLAWFVRDGAADEPGCIRCHGDEAVMKSLFKAPNIDMGEGEG